MSEKDIFEVFMRVQEPEYYDTIMLHIGAKFSEIVKIGETIEDGSESGKIAHVDASPGSSGLLKKKREEITVVSYGGRKTPRSSSYSQGRSRLSQNSHQACYTQASQPRYPSNLSECYLHILTRPSSTIPNFTPKLQKSISHLHKSSSFYQIRSPYQVIAPNCANVQSSYRAAPPVYQVQAPLYQNSPQKLPSYIAKLPNKSISRKPRSPSKYLKLSIGSSSSTRNLWPSPTQTREKAFKKLQCTRWKPNKDVRATGCGRIHPPCGAQTHGCQYKILKLDKRCDYHSNSVGHDTEDCNNLNHKIRDLIDQEVVSLQPAAPNVNTNPLPNHGGNNVNMIEIDDDWCGTKMITPIVHDDLEKL